MKKIILISSVFFAMPILNSLAIFSFLNEQIQNKVSNTDWSKFAKDAFEMKVGRKIDDEIIENDNLELNTISLVYNFNEEKKFNYQNHLFSEAWENGRESNAQWTFKLPNRVSFDRFKILSFNSFSRFQNKNFADSYTKTNWDNKSYYGKSVADVFQNKDITHLLENNLEVLLNTDNKYWAKWGFKTKQTVTFNTFVYQESSYFQFKLTHCSLKQSENDKNGSVSFSLGSDISLYVDDFPID